MNETLKAPFPWFGGKRRVADVVWSRFGSPMNYVEPFFGSGAVLLGRPDDASTETINDKDALVSNFWRAIQHDPDATAAHADYPVFENDLHARHAWLLSQLGSLAAKIEGDPGYFDAKIAGWWCWGICCWIGGGFCSGNGPWQVVDRKLVHAGDAGQGVNRKRGAIENWFRSLSDRLSNVRVCCGDWSRICGPSVTFKHGLTCVFLDPPYSTEADRDMNLYRTDCGDVAHDARAWAIENGGNPLMRIALCGYAGEYEMPGDWECWAWKASGGMQSNKNGNSRKERIWFSPHCLRPELNLFGVTPGMKV